MSNLAKFLMLSFIGLLLAAISIWFIGGKKQQFETTTTFNARASQIFPFVVDPELKKKWLQGLVEHEVIDSSEIGEGTQLRTVLESNGQTNEFDDLVIRFAENEIITIKSSSTPMMQTSLFRLKENGDKTELTYRRIIQFNGMERFKSVFMENQFQREIEDDMNRLVKLIESQPPDAGETEVGDPATIGVESNGEEAETPDSTGDDESTDEEPGR